MKRDATTKARRLILLGSSGSIGVNTLAVIEHLRSIGAIDYEVVGLAVGCNANLVGEQARTFGVRHVAIAEATKADAIEGVEHVYRGEDSSLQLINAIAEKGDLVVGAMVGSAGVPATLAAIEKGCDIALANKETLVAAGTLVMPLVKKKGVTLIPIDSEHSAIFQCLLAGRSIEEVKRLVITASGGPFRTWSKEKIENATPDQALNHPTWNMGPKVTIDSASLMNKALEVIEAHWLFDLPAEKISTIIHPQSIIHSFVEFVDGSVISQLGPPDMRTPIQYALTWPDRAGGCSKTMDWESLRQMEFEPVDHEKFGSLKLAYRVIEAGGTSGAIFNAANEEAVGAFLDQKIPFGQITRLVEETLDVMEIKQVCCMDDVLTADKAAREFVKQQVSGHEGKPNVATTPASSVSG